MTWEPSPVQQPETAPPRAAANLGLAEQFATFAEYAASTASFPRSAATSLDVARFHAFTGEITFATDPSVRLYLDGGSTYHAERDGGPSLSRLILDAGVIDSVQLQRGVISVGGAEHLGRLFDRDATVDRDAVMVVVENATDAIVQELANSVVATVTASAYRHHPSGIHRWFVAPSEPTGAQRPASGVAQVDRSVVDELPRLGPSEGRLPEPTTPAADEVRIEWSEPDPAGLGIAAPTHDAASEGPRSHASIDIQAELDRFDADRADWAAAEGDGAPGQSDSIASPLGSFRIVWPDGTRDASIIDSRAGTPGPAPSEAEQTITGPQAPTSPHAGPSAESVDPFAVGPVGSDPAAVDPAAVDPAAVDPAAVDPAAVDPVGAGWVGAGWVGVGWVGVGPIDAEPVVVEPIAGDLIAADPVDEVPVTSRPSLPAPAASPVGEADERPAPGRSMASDTSAHDAPGAGPLGFTIEPLQIDQIPEPDAAVPDDVAAAVRRALQAIENAAARPSRTAAADVHLTPVVVPDLTLTPPAASPTPAATSTASPSASPTADGAASGVAPGALTAPTVDGPTTEPVRVTAALRSPPAPEPESGTANEPTGFAPPTIDMRAEAVYERAAAQAEASSAAASSTTEPASSHPEPGQASIVFVDDEDDHQSERRSALRRLIGSLRNKD